jgi:hypothetical protein
MIIGPEGEEGGDEGGEVPDEAPPGAESNLSVEVNEPDVEVEVQE